MENPEFSLWFANADVDNPLWESFAQRENLTPKQLKQFQHYYALLVAWNQRINITRIIALSDVLAYHFSDSLEFGRVVQIPVDGFTIIDVGTGGGFPGIPLAIKYPQLRIVLLEVTQKKVVFLQEVIIALNLPQVTINKIDWQNYLHHAEIKPDFVCARASLQVPELIKVFQAGPLFSQTQVVYWASKQWKMPAEYAAAIVRDHHYQVGEKIRRLIFLKKIKNSKR
jgi:16S rRNA (guanine527-N7)-methyltransferase